MLAEHSNWGRPRFGFQMPSFCFPFLCAVRGKAVTSPKTVPLCLLPADPPDQRERLPEHTAGPGDKGQGGKVSGSVLRSCSKDTSRHFWLFQASVQEEADFFNKQTS